MNQPGCKKAARPATRSSQPVQWGIVRFFQIRNRTIRGRLRRVSIVRHENCGSRRLIGLGKFADHRDSAEGSSVRLKL